MRSPIVLGVAAVVTLIAAAILFVAGIPPESCTAHDVGCDEVAAWIEPAFVATAIASVVFAACFIGTLFRR